MRRRDFVRAIASAVAAWPATGHGQRMRIPILGFVSFGQREAALQSSWYPAFHEGLREGGWIPDRNLSIEYRFANNEPERLAALARDLVDLGPDVIFVPTRPALPAVRKATATIPIVFVSLGDPVAEGWIASLAKPGGNLTGVAGLSPELAGKRLELLRELVPSLSKVAVLWNPANSAEEFAVRMTETAARNLAIAISVEQLHQPADFDPAITRVTQSGAQSIVVLPDPMFLANREQLVRLIETVRIPAIYMETGFADVGGLVSFGPNLPGIMRRAAGYVDKILRGAKPDDLPVELPTTFELIVNLKTATAIGLTVPTSILLRATQLIE
jgi:putative tryptophan/tyrosine transport system substrate-binding protein